MNEKEQLQAEDSRLVPVYQKFLVRLVRGEGALLFDEFGGEFIDLSGGYGVSIVGHSNPRVAQAVSEQSSKLITCHGSIYNDAREAYLKSITKVLPKNLTRLFLCNSGAEANEAAIKFARKASGKKKIVAFTGSYHGKTYGALSVTWTQKYRKDFEPLVEGFAFSPFGNLQKAREVVDNSTAAIIVEPIQGESGVHVPPDDFLPGLRRLADERGSFLVFDEVQSGFGRTGKIWACEHWDTAPDILTSSKGVAGGVPFGLTAVSERIASTLRTGDHTSTFGGNPLACAAAKAALDFLLEGRLPERATDNGEYFRARLEEVRAKHPSTVREVRGKGLMVAMELKIAVKDVIELAYRRNLVMLYSGLNVLRFLPPLVITKEQLETASQRIDSILSEVESQLVRASGRPAAKELRAAAHYVGGGSVAHSLD